MATHILTRIEELFTKALQEKTGWGKNDVLITYQNCVKNALIEDLAHVPNDRALNLLSQLRIALLKGEFSKVGALVEHIEDSVK